MKILLSALVLLSLTSCGSLGLTPHKRINEVVDDCVQKYLNLDVKPQVALTICTSIYRNQSDKADDQVDTKK